MIYIIHEITLDVAFMDGNSRWGMTQNQVRLSSLNYLTPAEFVSQCEVTGEYISRSFAMVDQGLYSLTVGGT